MKAADFDYYRVDSLEDAIERLGELGEDAKVLAGGQSLVPMMNFRLARPAALVDITRVPELRGIERDNGDAAHPAPRRRTPRSSTPPSSRAATRSCAPPRSGSATSRSAAAARSAAASPTPTPPPSGA